MAHVAFDRPARPSLSARVLAEDVSEHLDYGVRDIAVIILATHVTTFSREVITVTNLAVLGTAVVFIHGIRGRMGTIGVDTFAVLIDGDKILRFETDWRQVSEKEFLRAAHDSLSRPQLLRRFIRGLSRQGLTRHDVLLDARVTVLANTLMVCQLDRSRVIFIRGTIPFGNVCKSAYCCHLWQKPP